MQILYVITKVFYSALAVGSAIFLVACLSGAGVAVASPGVLAVSAHGNRMSAEGSPGDFVERPNVYEYNEEQKVVAIEERVAREKAERERAEAESEEAACPVASECVQPAEGEELQAQTWSQAANTGNAYPTRVYVHTLYRQARLSVRQVRLGRRAVRALVERVRRGCHGVLSGAPTGKRAEAIRTEVVFDPLVVLSTQGRGASRRAADKLERLRWQSGTLTRLVHQQAHQIRAEDALVVPSICRDARSWAKSDFRVVPRESRHFDRAIDRLVRAPEVEPRILRLLAPYETPRERKMARSAKRIEKSVANKGVPIWLKAAGEIVRALGIQQPTAPSVRIVGAPRRSAAASRTSRIRVLHDWTVETPEWVREAIAETVQRPRATKSLAPSRVGSRRKARL